MEKSFEEVLVQFYVDQYRENAKRSTGKPVKLAHYIHRLNNIKKSRHKSDFFKRIMFVELHKIKSRNRENREKYNIEYNFIFFINLFYHHNAPVCYLILQPIWQIFGYLFGGKFFLKVP